MEDTAVRWSEYDGHHRQIVQETLSSVATSLSELMESAARNGHRPEYLNGVEASMMLVLRRMRHTP